MHAMPMGMEKNADKPRAHVAEWKKAEVDELKKLILSYNTIAIADIAYIPSKQFQEIRSSLSDDALIRVSKKRLIKLAIEEAAKEKPEIKKLADYAIAQPALIFSDRNPFILYRKLEENKSKTYAKPNTIAQEDIVVHKGETDFAPGPILAELQKVGIPVALEKNKVVIKEDKVIVKKGEKISEELASALKKLEIMPVEIKLNLLAAYEDSIVFLPDILDVDINEVINNIIEAETRAINLAVNSGYVTRRTADMAIMKAYLNAINLGVNAGIYEKETIKILISRAYANAKKIEEIAKR